MGHHRFPAFARLLPAVAGSIAFLGSAGCGSSTSTSTAPSTISRCGVTLAVPDSTMPAVGGTGRITVATERECAWSAVSEASWLSIISTVSGQGDGFVDFRAAPNPDPVVRNGAVLLNNQRASVAQAAGECVVTLRESAASFSRSGGSGSVNVVPSSQLCTWTASSDSDWITLTPLVNGKGTASVAFSVAPTTGPPRTGTITVAGQRFSVTQAEGCAYAVSPQSDAVGAAGGERSLGVAAGPGCPWVSGSNVPWITAAEGTSGSGPGIVRYVVLPTSGPERIGTLVVAGQVVTVAQASGCSFSITPESQRFPGTGGTGTVAVTTGSGCVWSASSNVTWVTVTQGTTGSGSGTVRFSVAASTGAERSGTVTIAGRTFTVTQDQGCTYTLSPESTVVAASGGTKEFTVQAASGCSWTAVSNASWMVVREGASGSGNGTVKLEMSANPGAPRSGTVTAAGKTFTVQQESGCTYSLSSDGASVPSSGGNGSVNVTTVAGCGWTAVSNVNWVSITSGASGSGNGTVAFTVSGSSGPARSGTLTIAGRTFTIDQASGCAYSISPQQQSVAASGGNISVGVTASGACSWAAASNAPWITVAQNSSGTGNGTVTLAVAVNTEPERTGTATIAGLTFTVQQASGCTYSVSPQSRTADASGGGNTFNVSTSAVCPWTAVSDVPWIAISNPAGLGNGKVDYVVAPNTGATRTGRITVGNAVFTVTQSGT